MGTVVLYVEVYKFKSTFGTQDHVTIVCMCVCGWVGVIVGVYNKPITIILYIVSLVIYN